MPATPIGRIVDLAATVRARLGWRKQPEPSPAVRARQPPREPLQNPSPHSVLRRPARHVTCLPACAIRASVGPSSHPGLQRVGAGSSRGSFDPSRDQRFEAYAIAGPSRRPHARLCQGCGAANASRASSLSREQRQHHATAPLGSTNRVDHRLSQVHPLLHRDPSRRHTGTNQWLGVSRKRRTVWDACDKRYPIERPRSRRLPPAEREPTPWTDRSPAQAAGLLAPRARNRRQCRS